MDFASLLYFSNIYFVNLLFFLEVSQKLEKFKEYIVIVVVL